jgi:heme-degrading monooxygenase HmoA
VYVVMWEFVVKPDQVAAFERAYAPDGDWAHLFAPNPGFLAIQLLRDADAPGRYVTIDTWRTAQDHGRAMAAFAAAYQELDGRCAGFSVSERRLGSFIQSVA